MELLFSCTLSELNAELIVYRGLYNIAFLRLLFGHEVKCHFEIGFVCLQGVYLHTHLPGRPDSPLEWPVSGKSPLIGVMITIWSFLDKNVF